MTAQVVAIIGATFALIAVAVLILVSQVVTSTYRDDTLSRLDRLDGLGDRATEEER